MLSMLYADGVVDPSEVAAVMAVSCIDQSDFEAGLNVYRTKLFAPKQCVESVALSLKQVEQRTACLVLMLDLAMADGNLDGLEQDLFEDYVKAFDDVPSEIIERAMKVLGLKNNPTVFA